MAISFNQIPSGSRVPFMFVEFDTSRSQQGPSVQVFNGLIIGQKLAAGTKPAEQVDLVTSEAQAKEYYGAGSMLAHMVAAWLQDNKVTGLSVIALDDLGGGVQATGTITATGTATAAGTLSFMVAGRRYQAGVASGDAPTAIGAAMVAAVVADADAQVTAANAVGVVTFTANHKGTLGNQIDIRVNPFSDDVLPAGVTAPVVAMASGAGDPDISDAIAVMGEKQYNAIAQPYTDTSNLIAIETELADRWGPIRQNDGVAFTAKKDSFANLVTLGDARNSPHSSIMAVAGPTPSWQWAANTAGVAARFGSIDPARPFQTLPLSSLLPGDDSEQFTFNERDLLLKDGIATHNVDGGGVVRVERLITTFQENAFASPDTSLLDVNTLMTLSFLRFDFRSTFQNKYPRHKLAGDEVRLAPGQAIITPKVAKAEAISIFRGWEDLGLVENVTQFKRDILVERNVSDPNRLDFLLPPDLVNQFRVGAAQIAFLL